MSAPLGLVFPHQLFRESPLLAECRTLILVEEVLFFRQYSFHKVKIAFHRASMKFYEEHLISLGVEVLYIDSSDERSDIRVLLPHLQHLGIGTLHYIEPTDTWLSKRLTTAANEHGISLQQHSSPLFLSSYTETLDLLGKRKTLRQTDFYIAQRRMRGILTTKDGTPAGGKWTYDTDNRKRYPAGCTPPAIPECRMSVLANEAISYTERNFSRNPGSLADGLPYPATYDESLTWFDGFLNERFADYGAYQDAILKDDFFLHHSVISPMLNVGLITPSEIIHRTLEFAEKHSVPLNSTEGFIRQVMGWREFIRGVYELHGSRQRTRNYWGFSRKMPASFWHGNTGIVPVDATIHKVLRTGYCHHIERLMVLSNFMLLCEFHPDEVYRWFMEMFIDAYDWVMVPNVYGMGQFADGGLMSTKPYISGSNYLRKMSDYPQGSWPETWDALFWRFIHRQREYFMRNPRMRMMVALFDKMSDEKQHAYLRKADLFLANMDAAST